ncbi:hypothetical protein [Pulveribacter sp.]|uniref:hypothetical protein n=1 Tax=Pulveribacter sp. TaxID=2678893 RepID=UPI0028AD2363|nr:hypothetical protein [Pulveribacter sp.]
MASAKRAKVATAAARRLLAGLGLAAALGGCTATGGGTQAGAPGSQQGDGSGVTVFGTVDVNVSTQRSR